MAKKRNTMLITAALTAAGASVAGIWFWKQSKKKTESPSVSGPDKPEEPKSEEPSSVLEDTASADSLEESPSDVTLEKVPESDFTETVTADSSEVPSGQASGTEETDSSSCEAEEEGKVHFSSI